MLFQQRRRTIQEAVCKSNMWAFSQTPEVRTIDISSPIGRRSRASSSSASRFGPWQRGAYPIRTWRGCATKSFKSPFPRRRLSDPYLSTPPFPIKTWTITGRDTVPPQGGNPFIVRLDVGTSDRDQIGIGDRLRRNQQLSRKARQTPSAPGPS